MCLQDGVTGWVDAGSGGADNIDAVATVAREAPQIGRCLVNIARTGVAPEESCTTSVAPTWTWLEAPFHAIAMSLSASRRASRPTSPGRTISKRCGVRRPRPVDLPVMIHVGQNYSPLRALLALLKRGDIVTHMYAPGPHSLLDDRGRSVPEVMAARRRGIIFDFGNGVVDHFDWDTVEKATKQDFWPDTFSTDWNVMSRTTGVVDLPNVMSKFIMFGMPLSQIVAAATANAARVFPSFDDRGTLNVGAPADVAIMELREGTFEFLDNYKGTRVGRQRLFPIATVLAGKSVPRA